MKVVELFLNDSDSIAFLGDTHFDNRSPESRVDDLMVTAVSKMNDILNTCISRNVEALFLSGDVYNRVAVTHESVNVFGECLLKFKENGIRLFTILGNHDILRNSFDNFDRSPLQTMFTFGVIEHINLENRVIICNKSAMDNSRIRVDDSILVTPVDYFEYPPKAEESAKVNILLAHMFYNQSALMADEKHNLSRDVVRNLGYDYVVLGHDHEKYDIEYCGKSTVIRSGSLLRGTSHSYNFTRKPCFVIMSNLIGSLKDIKVEEVEIKHLPYEDVASSYVLNKRSLKTVSGLQSVLSNLADKLSEGSEVDGDRIYSILQNDENLPANCRALIFKYLQE